MAGGEVGWGGAVEAASGRAGEVRRARLRPPVDPSTVRPTRAHARGRGRRRPYRHSPPAGPSVHTYRHGFTERAALREASASPGAHVKNIFQMNTRQGSTTTWEGPRPAGLRRSAMPGARANGNACETDIKVADCFGSPRELVRVRACHPSSCLGRNPWDDADPNVSPPASRRPPRWTKFLRRRRRRVRWVANAAAAARASAFRSPGD